MLKMVAFDLDGTIANTIPMCLEVFKKAVFPYTQRMLSEEEVVNTFGLNESGMIQQIIPDEKNSKMALQRYHQLYEEMHYMCDTPFTKIYELLELLKQKNIILTLVTGKGSESCDITLQKFALKDYFEEIKTGSEIKPNKSDLLAELMQKYKLSQDEIIYVGDTVSDIKACTKIDICCLSAAWSPTAKILDLQTINKSNIFTKIESLQEYFLNKLQ